MNRQAAIVILVCITVPATASGLGATGTADRLPISIDAPSSATVGETVDISGSISPPEVPGDHTKDITVYLLVDGTQVDSKTVTVEDGKTADVSFSHEFADAGSHSVEIEASTTLVGTTYSGSTSTTIDVEKDVPSSVSLSADAPDATTIGEQTDVMATVELPAVSADVSGDFDVTLSSNGETKASKTVTVGDGQQQTVTLPVTFQETGERTLTLEATGTVAGESLSATTQETITVNGEEIGDPSIDATTPDTVTAGDQAPIDIAVSVPEATGTDTTADLTVTVRADGREKDTQDISVQDGQTRDITLSPTLTTPGETTLEIEATGSLLGESLSKTVTKPLTVEKQQPTIGNLSLSPRFPSTLTTNEQATITADIGVPAGIETVDTTEAQVTLRADGETLAEQSVSLTGSDDPSVSFTEVIEQEGETTFTITVSATIAGQSRSTSVTRTINVQNPTTATTVEGAAFAVPPSLEDEVTDYRAQAGLDNRINAFVLATQEQLYLVFTTDSPRKGRATVTGRQLDQSFATDDHQFQVITATKTDFETVGEQATIADIRANTDEYRRQLVRIDAVHRRLTTLTDPDAGENSTVSTTVGALSDTPRTAESLFANIGRHASRLSQNPNQTTTSALLEPSRRDRLVTFTFETKFWTDTDATTDGIVLDPAGKAYEFLRTYQAQQAIPTERNTPTIPTERNTPVLYVVDRSLDPQQMDAVDDITTQARSLDGEVVSVNARMYGGTVSVQEVLEHATGEPCGEDRLTVQTPQGPTCINVVQDVLLHSGVAWSSVPQSRSEILLVLGASSRHQDDPTNVTEGRYQIVGEVVSTERINESLPDGSLLLAYNITRTGDIDYCAVATESRKVIENQTARLRQWATTQIAGSANELGTDDLPRPQAACGRLQTLTAGQQQSVSLALLLGFRLETSKFGVEYRRRSLNSSESAPL